MGTIELFRDGMNTKVKCVHCGTLITIPMEMNELLEKLKVDDCIQNVFPMFNSEQREMVKTGTCTKCWDKIMCEW